MAQHPAQAIVELFQLLVDGFDRTSTQMGGYPFPSPLELPLMEETQPGRQEGYDGRRLVNPRGNVAAARGSSWFSRKRASLFW